MDQPRGQFQLTGAGTPQPGRAAQLDQQFHRFDRLRHFHLHESGRCSGPIASLAPAAEGGVVEMMFAGEVSSRKTTAIKCRQKLSPLS